MSSWKGDGATYLTALFKDPTPPPPLKSPSITKKSTKFELRSPTREPRRLEPPPSNFWMEMECHLSREKIRALNAEKKQLCEQAKRKKEANKRKKQQH